MNNLNNFRLRIGDDEYIPIMQGGMGMDISTSAMALEVARLGGIGHISDAIHGAVTDRRYGSDYGKERYEKYKEFKHLRNKSHAKFDLDQIHEAVSTLVSKTMEQKKGKGAIFINIMEKAGMNNAKATLGARLNASLDGGIDGISLAAGLHASSMGLMAENPRFREAKIGIIVSSARALKIFITKSARYNRLPDYIVVEGPLAGGHLGFKINNWEKFDLKTLVQEVLDFLKNEGLDIPVIPAGGIFTGSDATRFLEMGASAVQVATRFTVTKESGLPVKTQQRYFRVRTEEIVVNMVSPTGYPMRMMTDSPCINTSMVPNCERLGYLLNSSGHCPYIDAFHEEKERNPGKRVVVKDKTCICTYMKSFGTWTCGHFAYRLKETTNQLEDGSYQQLTVEDVFNDYLYSTDEKIVLPKK